MGDDFRLRVCKLFLNILELTQKPIIIESHLLADLILVVGVGRQHLDFLVLLLGDLTEDGGPQVHQIGERGVGHEALGNLFLVLGL